MIICLINRNIIVTHLYFYGSSLLIDLIDWYGDGDDTQSLHRKCFNTDRNTYSLHPIFNGKFPHLI